MESNGPAPFPWTPKLQRIPFAVASKYAAVGTGLWDELVSIAGLYMARAAKNYDPAKGVKPQTYLWCCARWGCRDYLSGKKESNNDAMFKGMVSLDDDSHGHDPLRDAVPAPAGEESRPCARSLLEEARGRMTAAEKSAVDLLLEGRPQREIADALGVSRTRVYQLLHSAAGRAVRSGASLPCERVTVPGVDLDALADLYRRAVTCYGQERIDARRKIREAEAPLARKAMELLAAGWSRVRVTTALGVPYGRICAWKRLMRRPKKPADAPQA